MGFPVAHGLKLAANAYIENMVVEQLASDPTADTAGRVWFNTTSKTWKASFLDAGGAVIVRTFATDEDLQAFISELASTTAGQGSANIGYSGHTGSNGNFSIAAVNAETALDSIVERIDQDREDLDNLVTGIVTPLQNELDAVETAVGLNTDGTLTTLSGTYTTGNTTVIAGIASLDAAVTATDAAAVVEQNARIAADALNVAKAGDSMTGDLNFGGTQIVTGLKAPVNDSDAANKYYVDSMAAGIDWKESVRIATTENIALSGELTIDGIVTVAGDRILVKDQTDASENGIYDVAAGAWARSTDADNNPAGEVTSGAAAFVEEGTDNASQGYKLSTAGDIILDTTDLAFVQVSGAGQITAGAGISKSGNELFLNFGAGIAELPSDEIGIEVYATGGLFTTTDGTNASTAAGATLGVKLDVDSKMVLAAGGLALDPAFISSLTNGNTALQNELDLTQTSAGLNADGTLPVLSGNYIVGDVTILAAVQSLDTAAKANEDAIAAEVLRAGNAESTIAAELDTVEAASGLETDGTYVADGAANYVASVTNLKDADTALDSQLKIVTDDLATETQARTNADATIQTELDAVEIGAGLNADGTYSPVAAADYISTATSTKDATAKLDVQLATTTGNLATMKTNYNATLYTYESTVAASTYTLTHNMGTAFIDAAVWVKDDVTGKFHNDLTAVTIDDANNITIDLTVARIIRVVVKSMEDLA